MSQSQLFPALTPLKTYPGRKGAAGEWQKIVSEIPKCKTFIEVMCGSAVISSIVIKTGCNIVINDVDSTVIDKHNYAAGVIKLNTDYRVLLAKMNYPEPVYFFDPPYLKQTRSYQADIYRYEWDYQDHVEFLKIARSLYAPAMITHYPCDLYNDQLKDWRKIEYKTMTRAGLRDSVLYVNFPQPVLLQCYRHIGENFTDRQRIKRKVQNMVNKLQREPGQQRAAILSAVIEKFSYVGK